MTTAAEDGGARRKHEWVPGTLMWIGHYALWTVIPYAVLTIVSDATGRPGWAAWTALPAVILFYGSVIIDSQYHHARLCERCFAATPLDPQAAVEKWKPALRADHRPKMILFILLIAFSWSVLSGFLLVDGTHWAHLPAHHAAWAYLIQDIPTIVIVAGYWVMARKHRDLYPWCPWCHWGDGGEAEEIPDPDPAVSKS